MRFILPSAIVLSLGAFAALASPELHAQAAIQIISSSDIDSDGGPDGGNVKMGFSFASPGMSFSFGGSPDDPTSPDGLIQLLQDEAIRQELALTQEQIDGMQKLQKRASERMQKAMQSLDIGKIASQAQKGEAGSIQLDTASLREKIESARADIQALNAKSVEELLLPHQYDRIRQLALQVEITKLGLGPSLTRGKLSQELNIRPDQKPELIRLARDIDERTRQKILELKREAREELLASLDDDQEKKAKELLGAFFDYKAPTLDDLSKRMSESVKAIRGKTEETKSTEGTADDSSSQP